VRLRSIQEIAAGAAAILASIFMTGEAHINTPRHEDPKQDRLAVRLIW